MGDEKTSFEVVRHGCMQPTYLCTYTSPTTFQSLLKLAKQEENSQQPYSLQMYCKDNLSLKYLADLSFQQSSVNWNVCFLELPFLRLPFFRTKQA